MSEYINKELCKECGGSCCKRNGCMYLPEDFESMEYDYLLNKIKEGNISICLNFITIHGTLELYKELNIKKIDPDHQDFWSYYLYLKVRNIDSGLIDFLGERSQCSMLTENGCAYSDNERPTFGLSLVPKKGEKCKQTAKKYFYEVDYDWIKHQDVLRKIVSELTNKTVDELIEEASKESYYIAAYLNTKSHYINHLDGIQAEFKYLNREINENLNVKKLILKSNLE